MGTTAQKLSKILETKEAIRTAINNKGGTLTTTDTFASYSTAIDSLPSGGGDPLKEFLDETKSASYLFSGRTYNSGEYSVWYYYLTYERLQKILNYDTTSSVTNIIGMFYYCNKLTEIPLIDTSQVKLMNYTFYYCENLITFPQLDTSKVTGMIYTFYGCKKLVTISQLNTSNVGSLSNTFAGCSSLETIPQLNTSKVTSMYNTFQSCYKLRKIDITHMNSSTGDTWGLANNCHSLMKFIIRNMNSIPKLNTNSFNGCYHFTGTTDATYNPQGLKDGRIYVPDDKVDALKTAENWSKYADIIVPLSTLVE